jgi:hypothetical protein
MTRLANYKLAEDGMTPVPCESSLEWAAWYEKGNRVLCQTDFGVLGEVSTVFLSIDHNWRDDGPPVLWETMVFGGPLDEEQYRDTSWVRAAARHRMTVRRLLREARAAFPGEPDEIAHPAYDALARLTGE